MNVARTMLVGLPLLAGCATGPSRAEQLKAQYREGAALDARAGSDPGYRSSEGYQQARWGMSMAEVQALYPAARVEGSTLRLEAPVADRPAQLLFRFADNRLSQVRVNLLQPHGQFDPLSGLLTRKYGKPTSVTPDTSGDDAVRAVAIAADVLAVLGSRGEHGLLAAQNLQTHQQLSEVQARQAAMSEPRGAIWYRPETRITLASDPVAEQLVIDYRARALSQANGIAERQEQERALNSL